MLTIQERWRFESIPNQLAIYSSHKPRLPREGRLDHEWHFLSSRGITAGTALPRDRPTARTHLGLTLRVPVIPPSAPVCQSEFILAQIVSLASWSKGTLFGQLNVRHAFNMIRGTSNDRSLIDADGKLTAPQNLVWLPPTFYVRSPIIHHTWIIPGYHSYHS